MRPAPSRAVSLLQALRPVAVVLGRLSLWVWIVLALLLLLFSRWDEGGSAGMRAVVTGTLTPVYAFLSHPTESFRAVQDSVRDIVQVYTQNKQLRAEQERLKRVQQVALALEVENTRLRELLHLIPPPNVRFFTARLVAGNGGPFVDNALIYTSDASELAEGMVVTENDKLVGQLAEVGSRSARVLLPGDPRSRIPVRLENSEQRAVLVGRLDGTPILRYLSPGATLSAGERVMSSGDGDFFPADLWVGTVLRQDKHGAWEVEPAIDRHRLHYVTILVREGAQE